VKRLIATEPNIGRRCQLFDAWLELNPFPLTTGEHMDKLKRYLQKGEGRLLGLN
jgi:hypothetical protein